MLGVVYFIIDLTNAIVLFGIFQQFDEIWKVNTSQDEQWNKAIANIGLQEHFSIIIQSIYGQGYAIEVAIDDIEFKNCKTTNPPAECSSDEWMCGDETQCIKIWQHCDGKNDCRDQTDENGCDQLTQLGDCNFDSVDWMRKCRWSDEGLEFQWSQAKEPRNNITGPTADHTGSGYFLYIDSSQHSKGERAGISTPLFKPSAGKCHLRFWYYMKGSAKMGKLEVISEGQGGQVYPLSIAQGPQEDEWLYNHLLVGNSQNYKVVFIATRGGDDMTDIAIDDVSFTSGCAEGGDAVIPTGPTAICLIDEFRCSSGDVKCIPSDWKCDCAMDCADGSDEVGCPDKCISSGAPKPVTTMTPVSEITDVTKKPTKQCEVGQHLCGDGDTCIYLLLMCDGIKDCPDNSDETGCSANLCKPEHYFCKDKASFPCIPRDKLCDGVKDCSDGSDESLCNCIPDFCKNEGNCSDTKRAPVCECKSGYSQNRCGKQIINPGREELVSFQSSGAGWIAGVVLGSIMLVSIVIVVWYKKNTNAERSRLPHAMDNPCYGLNAENEHNNFGNLNAHMPVRHEDGAGATGIENPLYAFKSDIK